MKNKCIEAFCFALYYYDLNDSDKTKQSLCTLHIDTQNGKGEDLSRVFIISKMIWEKSLQKVGKYLSFVIHDILSQAT